MGTIRTRIMGGNFHASQSFKTHELNEIETNTVYLVQSITNSVEVFEIPGFSTQCFSRYVASGAKQIPLSPARPSLQSANKRMAVFPSYPQQVSPDRTWKGVFGYSYEKICPIR